MPPRPTYLEAIEALQVLERLRPFWPVVVGTLPLGVDVPGSDIDIVCHAPDDGAFAAALWTHFAAESGFSLRQWTGMGRPVVAGFSAFGWPFEIFGARQPVAEQAGWRHFDVERRLLQLGGEALRRTVLELRRAGLKTEPAFCRALGLDGDPYARLLELQARDDRALAALLP